MGGERRGKSHDGTEQQRKQSFLPIHVSSVRLYKDFLVVPQDKGLLPGERQR